MDDVTKRISELVAKHGPAQYKFALICDINQANLSQILQGKRAAGNSVLNKISMALNVRKDWILTGEGEMYNKVTISDKDIQIADLIEANKTLIKTIDKLINA